MQNNLINNKVNYYSNINLYEDKKELTEKQNQISSCTDSIITKSLEKINCVEKISLKEKNSKSNKSQALSSISLPIFLEKTNLENERLIKKYDKGESIPSYIKEFNLYTKECEKSAENNIDHSLSGCLQKTIASTNPNIEKSIEFFLGPLEDMKKFYKTQSYSKISLLSMSDSKGVYCVENPKNSTDIKIIITGVLHSTELCHLLLQLKTTHINLNNVKIRGYFADVLKPILYKVESHLKQLEKTPELVFIGQPVQTLIELTSRLYPNEMKMRIHGNNEEIKIEEIAKDILSQNDHNLQNIDIGNKTFKYSYFKVQTVQGNEKGILTMTMPNGSLAREAIKLVTKNGAKHIVILGTGESVYNTLNEATKVGSYQIVTSSTYGKETLILPIRNQIKLNVIDKGSISTKNCKNMTIDSSILKTKEWKKKVREENFTSIDMETFHIFKGLMEAIKNDKTIQVFCGLSTYQIADSTSAGQITKAIQSEQVELPKVLDNIFNYESIIDNRKSKQ